MKRRLFTAALGLVGCGALPHPVPAASPPSVSTPETSLSYLRPVASTLCDWIRHPLPSGEPVTLVTLSSPCEELRLAWSPSGQEGLVYSSLRGMGRRPYLLRVDFRTGTQTPLDLSPLLDEKKEGAAYREPPSVARVAFDVKGTPVVLVLLRAEPETGPRGEPFFLFQGQRHPIQGFERGLEVALAFRWEDTGWKLLEAKGVPFEDASAERLEASRSLYSPWSASGHTLPGQRASEEVSRRLDAALHPRDKWGWWMSLPTPGGRVLYRARRPNAESEPEVFAPLRWERDGGEVDLEVVDGGNTSLGLQQQGTWLAVTTYSGQLGASSSTWVFDLRTGRPRLALPATPYVLFWPVPREP